MLITGYVHDELNGLYVHDFSLMQNSMVVDGYQPVKLSMTALGYVNEWLSMVNLTVIH